MGRWNIQWMPEVASQIQAFQAAYDAEHPDETAEGIDHQGFAYAEATYENVVADEVRVEGGAVVFVRDDRIDMIIGPGSYRSVLNIDNADE